ncbi:MAG: hypothetical protein FWE37_04865 [Spirochaetaceae bacterium]|nr:hypothetical protein [Spirochaetaceae bacterium]
MKQLKVLWLSVFLLVLASNIKAQSYVFNPTINPDKSITFNIYDWQIVSSIFWDYTRYITFNRSAFNWESFKLSSTGEGTQFLELFNQVALVLHGNYNMESINKLTLLVRLAFNGVEQGRSVIIPSGHYNFFQAFFIYTQPMVEAFIAHFRWN